MARIKTTNTMKKIKASIAQTGLHYVTDFFNQNLVTVLGELLQNSRRAGATSVKVTTSPAGESRLKVVIEDNGSGIKEPEKLLTLWDSGWEAETMTLESPAGFGFFSLAHLPDGVSVRSLDWQMHIDQHVFKGSGEAECKPTTDTLRGTRLTFYLGVDSFRMLSFGNISEAFKSRLAEAVHYYPVPVELNGAKMEQEDFLAKANWRRQFDGVTVGIYTSDPYRLHNNVMQNPRINFYGVTLHARLDVPQPGWHVRLDVTGACALDLVKPARNAVVENQKWADMQAMIRRAVYEVCQTTPHDLPYSDWLEAASMGLKLPEAQPVLQVDTPTDIGDSDNQSFDLAPSYKGAEMTARACATDIINQLDNAELLALHLSGANIPLMFLPARDKEGYSWYPKRTATELVQIVKNGKTTSKLSVRSSDWGDKAVAKLNAPRGFVDSIQLQLTVSDGKGKSEILKYPTHIAFGSDEWGDADISNHWVCIKEKFAEISVADLQAIFFYYSEDASDGRDTQESDFWAAAQKELARRRGGDTAANKLAIEQAVGNGLVARAMKNLKVDQVTLCLGKDGCVKVRLP